jgi:AhpC/TSA family
VLSSLHIRPIVVLVLLAVLASGCHANHSQNYDLALSDVRGGTFHLPSDGSSPVLLAFLQTVPDAADTPSRSQMVFLASMAHQYGPRGLKVVVVDASGLVNPWEPDHNALVNASYDWQMNFPLLEDPGNRVANRFGVTRPPTLILFAADGTISQRWQGLTGPAMLAQAIERFVGGPLGQLPSL